VSYISRLSNITRSQGDPKVLGTGPSSLGTSDQLGHALGWFSLGLGLVELLSPRSVTRVLGMEGREGLVQAYGAREIGSGLLSLSLERDVGLWSRVAGDGLDIATVVAAYRPSNPKRSNVGVALVALVGITLLDLVAAQGVAARHARRRDNVRDYRNRSGFPQGVAKARGMARASTERSSFNKTPKQAAL
jgi:hypothetical protein